MGAEARRRLTLAQIAEQLGGEVQGDATTVVSGVATLEHARPDQISFLANPRYRKPLQSTRAGAVILAPADRAATGLPCILTPNPYLYFARVITLFHPMEAPEPGLHSSAVVDPTATLPASVSVGPFSVIGPGCVLGEGAVIGAGCSIGKDVAIGAHTRLYPRVVVYDGCRIGSRVILHSGVVIGADGFGLAPDQGRWVKIPQVGSVLIGDDVEVGANTTIDRGALDDTVIEEGVKLDNQIQVAHNVRIGAHTAIAGCAGIAGSTRIGKRCTIGGGAGIAGHLEICDDVHVSGFTLIAKSIKRPGTYTSGLPVMEHSDWLKSASQLRHLDELAAKVRTLQQRLEQLEKDKS